MKHSWDRWTPPADAKYGTGWGYRVARLCTRCGAISYCQINVLGQKEPWRYKLPDGYSLSADEVPTQEELALAFLGRTKNDDYYGDKPIAPVVKKKAAAPAKKHSPTRRKRTPHKGTVRKPARRTPARV